MGRIMAVLGVVLLIVGIGGMLTNGFSPTNSLTDAPTAEQLCEEGETLVDETGASVYTPGQGYGRSVQYYCEDEDGNRRNVTGEFVEDLFGSAGGFIGDMMGSFLWGGLASLGGTLLTLGLIFTFVGRMNRQTQQMVGQYTSTFTPTTYVSPSTPTSPPAPSGGTLADRLRQLDDARAQGLLKPEEYERLRKQALDELK